MLLPDEAAVTDIQRGNHAHHVITPPPFTLRIAAILCCAVGFYSLLPSIVLGVQAFGRHEAPWLPLLAAPVSALMIGVAGVLLWLRRRLGVVVLVIGAVLPAIVNATSGLTVHRPSVLLVVAAVLVLMNLRQLHGRRPA